jgi:hypothetical protein
MRRMERAAAADIAYINAEETNEAYKRAERLNQGEHLTRYGMQLSNQLDDYINDTADGRPAQELTLRKFKQAFDQAAIANIFCYMNRP